MNRKKSREITMELLFGMSLNKNSVDETIEMFEELYEGNLQELDLGYTRTILTKIEEHKEEIDEKIKGSLTNWKIERIAKINLTILRLAVCEMLYLNDDIPEKVSINEGIELTKRYSDEKSVSFVNGVLDKIYRMN